MEQILKELGLNSIEELVEWVENNPDTPLAQSIQELLGIIKENEYKG